MGHERQLRQEFLSSRHIGPFELAINVAGLLRWPLTFSCFGFAKCGMIDNITSVLSRFVNCFFFGFATCGMMDNNTSVLPRLVNCFFKLGRPGLILQVVLQQLSEAQKRNANQTLPWMHAG